MFFAALLSLSIYCYNNMKRLENSGYHMNFILLGMESLYFMVTFGFAFGFYLPAAILTVVLFGAWCVPNALYFYTRSGLFNGGFQSVLNRVGA